MSLAELHKYTRTIVKLRTHWIAGCGQPAVRFGGRGEVNPYPRWAHGKALSGLSALGGGWGRLSGALPQAGMRRAVGAGAGNRSRLQLYDSGVAARVAVSSGRWPDGTGGSPVPPFPISESGLKPYAVGIIPALLRMEQQRRDWRRPFADLGLAGGTPAPLEDLLVKKITRFELAGFGQGC